jgi:hypothetical protein
MTTYEVYLLFKRYTDEPDQSFMSDSEAALFLKLGYSEFLRYVDEINPFVRLRGTNITLTGNSQSYDLTQQNSPQTALGTPSVLGPNPNQTTDGVSWMNLGRLTKLVSVVELSTSVPGQVVQTYQLVQNENQLNNNNSIVWQGNTLTFFSSLQRTLTLLYNYEQEIGFPAAAAGPVASGQPSQSWSGVITQATAVTIDDNLQAWHDMIALFAYAQYAIVDAASNVQLVQHLESRKMQLRDYLMTRSFGATQYISNTNDPSDVSIYIA